jgi:hypothetical protein
MRPCFRFKEGCTDQSRAGSHDVTSHLHCSDVVPDEKRREAIGHLRQYIDDLMCAHLECEASELQ